MEPNTSQDEKTRLFLRQKCLDSLYFFLKLIFGFKDLDPLFHLPVCVFLSGPSKRKLLVLPRGHLKSSIATIGYAAWRATKNPEMRILISNATASNAQGFLRSIADTLKTSAMYQWLFPELIPNFNSRDTQWNDDGITLKRNGKWTEATIECIGMGGTVVSRHYNLIIEDDLVNEDHIKTPEMMQKVVDWHKYAESLMISPGEDERLVVGTRWAFNDIISYVIDNEDDYSKVVRSVLENGKPIWPQRFPEPVIAQIRVKQGAKIFSCQYMNDPVHDSTQSFNMTWIRRFADIPTTPLNFYTAIDPALSESKGDFSAIVTVAMDPYRNLYVVEAKHGRWGVDALISQAFKTFHIWKSTAVGLETIMFQKALLWPFKEAMRREHTHMNIVELKPSSKMTKEARIVAMQDYLANGSLWLREGLLDLEREMKEFPVGAHDDLLDALAYAVQMASPAVLVHKEDTNPFKLSNILAQLKDRGKKDDFWVWHHPYQERVH